MQTKISVCARKKQSALQSNDKAMIEAQASRLTALEARMHWSKSACTALRNSAETAKQGLLRVSWPFLTVTTEETAAALQLQLQQRMIREKSRDKAVGSESSTVQVGLDAERGDGGAVYSVDGSRRVVSEVDADKDTGIMVGLERTATFDRRWGRTRGLLRRSVCNASMVVYSRLEKESALVCMPVCVYVYIYTCICCVNIVVYSRLEKESAMVCMYVCFCTMMYTCIRYIHDGVL
jgi:hypothetical protein